MRCPRSRQCVELTVVAAQVPDCSVNFSTEAVQEEDLLDEVLRGNVVEPGEVRVQVYRRVGGLHEPSKPVRLRRPGVIRCGPHDLVVDRASPFLFRGGTRGVDGARKERRGLAH
jgi:hypothetical protein